MKLPEVPFSKMPNLQRHNTLVACLCFLYLKTSWKYTELDLRKEPPDSGFFRSTNVLCLCKLGIFEIGTSGNFTNLELCQNFKISQFTHQNFWIVTMLNLQYLPCIKRSDDGAIILSYLCIIMPIIYLLFIHNNINHLLVIYVQKYQLSTCYLCINITQSLRDLCNK